jgi:Putative 2OG-Fe(II) oxygenase
MQWETELSPTGLQAAVELARRAVESHPGRSGNWMVLSHALAKLGKSSEAIVCLREALVMLPQASELHARLAELLLAEDQWEAALPHVETALACSPSDLYARRIHLDLLAMLSAQNSPDFDSISADSVHLLRLQARRRSPAGVVELCNDLLAENPGHTDAIYIKALALARLGRAEEARKLISIDRLVEVQALPSPAGGGDERAFRDAVAAEIRANPTLAGDPRGKATRDGLVTRALRQPGATAIEALLGRFKRAVDVYVERLVSAGHEFALRRPRRARIEAWGTIYGSQGQQGAHIHPAGWLSGVYYVSAAPSERGGALRGPLVLGAMEQRDRCIDPPWGMREVEPTPGTLVLFPSYVPHATLASGVHGARISVAFDVVDATDPGPQFFERK